MTPEMRKLAAQLEVETDRDRILELALELDRMMDEHERQMKSQYTPKGLNT